MNYLNDSNNKNSKFPTKKWYVINDESKVVTHPKIKSNFQQVY